MWVVCSPFDWLIGAGAKPSVLFCPLMVGVGARGGVQSWILRDVLLSVPCPLTYPPPCPVPDAARLFFPGNMDSVFSGLVPVLFYFHHLRANEPQVVDTLRCCVTVPELGALGIFNPTAHRG